MILGLLKGRARFEKTGSDLEALSGRTILRDESSWRFYPICNLSHWRRSLFPAQANPSLWCSPIRRRSVLRSCGFGVFLGWQSRHIDIFEQDQTCKTQLLQGLSLFLSIFPNTLIWFSIQYSRLFKVLLKNCQIWEMD